MNDTISRQAAIKIIENYCENGCDIAEDNWCPSCQREQFIKLLEALPSAEPEIVRCKDCKDYQTDWETSYPNRHYCATMDSMMPEDGFCSYAERKTNER